MREIKFRAWDSVRKKWLSHQDWVGHYDDLYFADLNEVILLLTKDDSLSVMQFTGLHDKNGKEIYEGDICKIVLDKIIPRYAITEVSWRDEYAGFNFTTRILENVINAGEGWSMSTHDRWEVIGNICENPELLK